MNLTFNTGNIELDQLLTVVKSAYGRITLTDLYDSCKPWFQTTYHRDIKDGEILWLLEQLINSVYDEPRFNLARKNIALEFILNRMSRSVDVWSLATPDQLIDVDLAIRDLINEYLTSLMLIRADWCSV